jgi:hypothetical protein
MERMLATRDEYTKEIGIESEDDDRNLDSARRGFCCGHSSLLGRNVTGKSGIVTFIGT